jgi:uncharacterized protein
VNQKHTTETVVSGNFSMSCELKQHLQTEVIKAMKAGEKKRLTTIRLIMAAIKQKEVDERVELSDTHVLEILTKMVKQRHDSINQFKTAERDDLVKIEQEELTILSEFMPPALNEAELDAIIAQAITDTAASSMKDMGKVMGLVKAAAAGRADMGQVSKKIKAALV